MSAISNFFGLSYGAEASQQAAAHFAEMPVEEVRVAAPYFDDLPTAKERIGVIDALYRIVDCYRSPLLIHIGPLIKQVRTGDARVALINAFGNSCIAPSEFPRYAAVLNRLAPEVRAGVVLFLAPLPPEEVDAESAANALKLHAVLKDDVKAHFKETFHRCRLNRAKLAKIASLMTPSTGEHKQLITINDVAHSLS